MTQIVPIISGATPISMEEAVSFLSTYEGLEDTVKNPIKLWELMVNYLANENQSGFLGLPLISQQNFAGSNNNTIFAYLNNNIDLPDSRFKTLLNNYKGQIDLSTPSGTTYNAPFWNESVSYLMANLLADFDLSTIKSLENQGFNENISPVQRPNARIKNNGQAAFRITDVISADAGRDFSQYYVRPSYNIQGQKYTDVRNSDLISTDAKNSGQLQYTNSTNDYLRLLMPMYTRQVKVEDLDRNFWVIGQSIAAICAYLFEDDSPLVNILNKMLNEIFQLWENVLFLWVLTALNTYKEEEKYTDVHCEVVPYPQNANMHNYKYDNAYYNDVDFDGNSFKGTLYDFGEGIKGELITTDSTNATYSKILKNNIKLFSYLKDSYPKSNLCIIPFIRCHNYEHNYYSVEYYPGVIYYDRNSDKWGMQSFKINQESDTTKKPDYRSYDANLDKSITVQDLIRMQKYINGDEVDFTGQLYSELIKNNTIEQYYKIDPTNNLNDFIVGDANNDKEINIKDTIRIQKLINEHNDIELNEDGSIKSESGGNSNPGITVINNDYGILIVASFYKQYIGAISDEIDNKRYYVYPFSDLEEKTEYEPKTYRTILRTIFDNNSVSASLSGKEINGMNVRLNRFSMLIEDVARNLEIESDPDSEENPMPIILYELNKNETDGTLDIETVSIIKQPEANQHILGKEIKITKGYYLGELVSETKRSNQKNYTFKTKEINLMPIKNNQAWNNISKINNYDENQFKQIADIDKDKESIQINIVTHDSDLYHQSEKTNLHKYYVDGVEIVPNGTTIPDKILDVSLSDNNIISSNSSNNFLNSYREQVYSYAQITAPFLEKGIDYSNYIGYNYLPKAGNITDGIVSSILVPQKNNDNGILSLPSDEDNASIKRARQSWDYTLFEIYATEKPITKDNWIISVVKTNCIFGALPSFKPYDSINNIKVLTNISDDVLTYDKNNEDVINIIKNMIKNNVVKAHISTTLQLNNSSIKKYIIPFFLIGYPMPDKDNEDYNTSDYTKLYKDFNTLYDIVSKTDNNNTIKTAIMNSEIQLIPAFLNQQWHYYFNANGEVHYEHKYIYNYNSNESNTKTKYDNEQEYNRLKQQVKTQVKPYGREASIMDNGKIPFNFDIYPHNGYNY